MGLLVVCWLLATLACSVVQAEHAQRPYIAFVSMPFKGHATPVHALAQELSGRGYETDFITMDYPPFTGALARAQGPRYVSLFPYKQVCSPDDLQLSFLMGGGTVKKSDVAPERAAAVWRCVFIYYEDFLPALTHKFLERRPDLVVADSFTLAAIDAAFNLSIPLVINHPSVYTTQSFDLPAGWSAFHSWGAKVLRSKGVLASLRRWLNHTQRRFFSTIGGETPVHFAQKALRKRSGDPSFVNLPLTASVPNLVNIFFGLEYAQPVPPHYTLIGPVLSAEAEAEIVGSDENNESAASLEDCPEIHWLDGLVQENSDVQVILINFGTTGVLKPRQVQAMLKGFAELNTNQTTPAFRVMWRIREEQYRSAFEAQNEPIPPIPSYVHFVPWLCSQAAVLRHPAVHLFISHAGINSAQEAILAGVPILAIPSMVDQHAMAVRITDAGVGLALPPNHFTSGTFSRAVSQILHPQAAFSRAAQELRKFLVSDPTGLGRVRGANVIEDVLHRDYKYLIPQEILTQPGWAKSGLDVVVLDVVTIVGLLWLVRNIVQKSRGIVRYIQRQRLGGRGPGSLKLD
ncbi:glycosyltransferase family 1 protein [Ramaria rubella]|nr:glycosyltransferase family 1 protein [Ramaria rubella]